MAERMHTELWGGKGCWVRVLLSPLPSHGYLLAPPPAFLPHPRGGGNIGWVGNSGIMVVQAATTS